MRWSFATTAGLVRLHAVSPAKDFAEVECLDGDSRPFEELLAVSDRVESGGPSPDRADAGGAKAPNDAANRSEAGEVGAELGRVGGDGVARGEAKQDPVLAEVVADRHLAAERIPTVGERHALGVVGEGVDEHGHVEAREADRVGNGLLIAEVGEGDENSVDAIRMFFEDLGAGPSVLEALDGTELPCLGGQGYDIESRFREYGEHRLAPCLAEMRGEETAVADDEPKGGPVHGASLARRHTKPRQAGFPSRFALLTDLPTSWRGDCLAS